MFLKLGVQYCRRGLAFIGVPDFLNWAQETASGTLVTMSPAQPGP